MAMPGSSSSSARTSTSSRQIRPGPSWQCTRRAPQWLWPWGPSCAFSTPSEAPGSNGCRCGSWAFACSAAAAAAAALPACHCLLIAQSFSALPPGPRSCTRLSASLRRARGSSRARGSKQQRPSFVGLHLMRPAATCWRAAKTRRPGCGCGTAQPGSCCRACEAGRGDAGGPQGCAVTPCSAAAVNCPTSAAVPHSRSCADLTLIFTAISPSSQQGAQEGDHLCLYSRRSPHAGG